MVRKSTPSRTSEPAAPPSPGTEGRKVTAAGQEILCPNVTPEVDAFLKAKERYGAVNVDCEEVYVWVNDQLTEVKTRLKNTKALIARLQSPLEKIRKEAVDGKNVVANEFAGLITLYETCESLLKSKMTAYIAEQDRKQREEERRQRALQEEEDRKRRQRAEEEARAEAERRAAEARRLEEEARKVAKKDAERAAQLRDEAAQVLEQGAQIQEEILSEAEAQTGQPVVVAHTTPKLAGTAVKRPWVARAPSTPDEVKEFCQGVIDGKNPVETVVVAMPFYRTEAARLGEEFDYPGITCTQDVQIAKR